VFKIISLNEFYLTFEMRILLNYLLKKENKYMSRKLKVTKKKVKAARQKTTLTTHLF